MPRSRNTVGTRKLNARSSCGVPFILYLHWDKCPRRSTDCFSRPFLTTMYILTIRPSCLIFVAIGLAFIQSVHSHPIQANNWAKADQFGDIISGGSGKVFEKEGHHSMSDPLPHVNNNHSPTWQTTNNINEPQDQGQPDYSQKGVSSSENPIISVVLPTLSAKIPEKMHKHYTDNIKQQSEHISELEESTLNAIAADRQNRYNDILRQMHTKNTLNREPDEKTPAFFSFSSSGYSVSVFAYRFSISTLRLTTAGFSKYPLPGVFTTVIILLAMVWIALFTIGLVELGNYLWSRRGQTVVGNGNGDGEDQNFELDELMKMPLGVVAIPGDETRVNSLIQPEYEFLDAWSIDCDSESSTSDEDDYRIF